jgi:demethoxyubiquinone hydroxylase (CLK1/Coq7/Cat5 family)
VETFAMRISEDEHAKLKATAEALALPVAALVRQAVNLLCRTAEQPAVFREVRRLRA